MNIRKGNDIAIVSYGTIVSLAFELSKKIEVLHNKKCSIISSHTIKITMNVVWKILKNHKKVIIIEEHVKNRSLSDKVKVLPWTKIGTEIFSFTLKDEFYHFYGS